MKIEQLLKLVSDMEQFSPRGDNLSQLIQMQDDELSDSSLELVSAAGSKPDFSELLKKREKL